MRLRGCIAVEALSAVAFDVIDFASGVSTSPVRDAVHSNVVRGVRRGGGETNEAFHTRFGRGDGLMIREPDRGGGG